MINFIDYSTQSDMVSQAINIIIMEDTMNLNSRKYTIREAAHITSMSMSWWRQQCYSKKIQYLKIGRKVLIPEATLQKVLDDAIVEARIK
jgi:hypothetical protein